MRKRFKSYDFAIILGATGGIGSGISYELINQVEKIYIFGTNLEKLSALKNELSQIENLQIYTEQMNFEDNDLVIQAKIESLNLQKNVGILVNCVGTYVSKEFATLTYENITKDFLINVIRPMQIISSLVCYLEPGSLIINIGSSLSYHPKSNRVLTSSVKHAIRGFSLSLAEELAGLGIRVCLINPRSVATSLLKKNSSSESYQKAMPVEDIVRTVAMIVSCDDKTLFSEINVGASQGFLGQ
ncbi:MAG: SDR family oxidoreductase [Calothrix sp. MO_167.B12]|nr:SDR family oxidoreductase [Calothrix sp. MO_167.B12]